MRTYSKIHIFSMAILAALAVTPLAAQPWVDSFGTATDYRPPAYLSGYGYSDLDDRAERLEAARNAALAQLSRQVRVQITSEESIRTSDYGDGARNRYTNTVQATSDLQITGAEFEVVERRRATHVLAWVSLQMLSGQFRAEQEAALGEVTTLIEQFDRSIARGDLEQAERDLARLDTAFTTLTDAASLVRAVETLAGRPRALEGDASPVQIQAELEARRDRVRAFQPADAEQAAGFLARLLAAEVGPVERVTPLLYEDADFSSAFGSRFAGLLESAIAAERLAGETPVIVRGSYWPEQDSVELQIVARAIDSGRTVAAAHVSVPRDALDEATLRPANVDEALAAGAALLNDQIVNGGLDLEVWTDKGRNERALVFEEGEFVQFYFRVNQPAFLQLSYVLATGDTVLLEEQFYIGVDRVNRVVALPYRFRVVPPFGVERFVVTGYTNPPPPADVVARVIDGQQYTVFRSVGEAVRLSRGLVREDPPEEAGDTRVAEASLSITTVGKAE